MPEKRRDKEYLEDIKEAMARIVSYTEDMSKDAFFDDPKTQDAVVRNIEIIGEASKRIAEDIRNRYADIPWRDMAGIRDKLIRHYFGIDYEIVWRVVKHEIPVILPQISRIIDNEFGPSHS